MFPDRVLADPGTALDPLVPLDMMKDLLGVPAANTSLDTQITFATNVASGLIRAYVGRVLSYGSYGDLFVPNQNVGGREGAMVFSLSEFPVHEITEIKINGTVQTPSDIRLHRNTGRVEIGGYSYTDPVEMTYDAGYDPLPFDLMAVVLDVTKRQLSSMGVDLTSTGAPGASSQPIKAVTVGALKVDYAVATVAPTVGAVSASTLADYEEVLSLYRTDRMLAATPA